MPGTLKNWLAFITATALLFANCGPVFSRPPTSTGQPMEVKLLPSGTNSVPNAPWHTIKVSPAPGLPTIHFYDKVNPVWWLENADDPLPPAWYLPGDRHRVFKWRFRNPFHNFDHYVIGVADKNFSRSGHYPERNSDPRGGWDFEIARRELVVLPFLSFERPWCNFYLGWREHGAFGAKLIFPHQPKNSP
jgi:hypothetical protein